MVSYSPALDKADSNVAHVFALVHRLEALTHSVGKLTGKVLVAEHAHFAVGGNLADCRRVPLVV